MDALYEIFMTLEGIKQCDLGHKVDLCSLPKLLPSFKVGRIRYFTHVLLQVDEEISGLSL